MQEEISILGIDPGSHITGFACITKPPVMANDRRESMGILLKDVGVIRLKKEDSFNERIGNLHEAIYSLSQNLKPSICVLETAFYGENINTAIKMGEIRGAIISSLHRMRIPIFAITPAQVKKTIAGSGRASKEDIYYALQHLMKFQKGDLPFDACDAFAIALTYGLTLKSNVRSKSHEKNFETNLP